MIRRAGLLLLAVAALALGLPVNAWSVPADPRITAAVTAWKDQPVYVDPQYAEEVDAAQVEKMVARIATSPVPVFVAVVPSGAWFQEKGDEALLAGWMAAANGKPGMYLVIGDSVTTGVDHLVKASGPGRVYGTSAKDPSAQVIEYVDKIRLSERYEAEPARTTPLPPREERRSEPERFTVGKAIGNGLGGAMLGLMGGAVLAGVVLGVAALVARRGGGRS
ncbi:hypothetical protein [Kribbella italica]|uniref:TPM domain-containing protein n=1 Tax=Kribbella italica TaxID=1540520 RepID=A0A7W9JB82_9ACTN|nr:hypothetical protein [Kribbella italica]MBB5838969.1 hypothetical protein [Kribbella italica]